MFNIGDIVRHRTSKIKMTINSILEQDSFDLPMPGKKGDFECVWWDEKFQYEVFSSIELELVEEVQNGTFSIGDKVKLKSGSMEFIVTGIYGNELEINDSSTTHLKVIFKKLRSC